MPLEELSNDLASVCKHLLSPQSWKDKDVNKTVSRKIVKPGATEKVAWPTELPPLQAFGAFLTGYTDQVDFFSNLFTGINMDEAWKDSSESIQKDLQDYFRTLFALTKHYAALKARAAIMEIEFVAKRRVQAARMKEDEEQRYKEMLASLTHQRFKWHVFHPASPVLVYPLVLQTPESPEYLPCYLRLRMNSHKKITDTVGPLGFFPEAKKKEEPSFLALYDSTGVVRAQIDLHLITDVKKLPRQSEWAHSDNIHLQFEFKEEESESEEEDDDAQNTPSISREHSTSVEPMPDKHLDEQVDAVDTNQANEFPESGDSPKLEPTPVSVRFRIDSKDDAAKPKQMKSSLKANVRKLLSLTPAEETALIPFPATLPILVDALADELVTHIKAWVDGFPGFQQGQVCVHKSKIKSMQEDGSWLPCYCRVISYRLCIYADVRSVLPTKVIPIGPKTEVKVNEHSIVVSYEWEDTQTCFIFQGETPKDSPLLAAALKVAQDPRMSFNLLPKEQEVSVVKVGSPNLRGSSNAYGSIEGGKGGSFEGGKGGTIEGDKIGKPRTFHTADRAFSVLAPKGVGGKISPLLSSAAARQRTGSQIWTKDDKKAKADRSSGRGSDDYEKANAEERRKEFHKDASALLRFVDHQQPYFQYICEVAAIIDNNLTVVSVPSGKAWLRKALPNKLERQMRKRPLKMIANRCDEFNKMVLCTKEMMRNYSLYFEDSGLCSSSLIGFGFPGFASYTFDVGRFAVVSPWAFFKNDENVARLLEDDWRGALQSESVAKELMQASPDVSGLFQTDVERAKKVMFDVQVGILRNLAAAACIKDLASAERMPVGTTTMLAAEELLSRLGKAERERCLPPGTVYICCPNEETLNEMLGFIPEKVLEKNQLHGKDSDKAIENYDTLTNTLSKAEMQKFDSYRVMGNGLHFLFVLQLVFEHRKEYLDRITRGIRFWQGGENEHSNYLTAMVDLTKCVEEERKKVVRILNKLPKKGVLDYAIEQFEGFESATREPGAHNKKGDTVYDPAKRQTKQAPELMFDACRSLSAVSLAETGDDVLRNDAKPPDFPGPIGEMITDASQFVPPANMPKAVVVVTCDVQTEIVQDDNMIPIHDSPTSEVNLAQPADQPSTDHLKVEVEMGQFPKNSPKQGRNSFFAGTGAAAGTGPRPLPPGRLPPSSSNTSPSSSNPSPTNRTLPIQTHSVQKPKHETSLVLDASQVDSILQRGRIPSELADTCESQSGSAELSSPPPKIVMSPPTSNNSSPSSSTTLPANALASSSSIGVPKKRFVPPPSRKAPHKTPPPHPRLPCQETRRLAARRPCSPFHWA